MKTYFTSILLVLVLPVYAQIMNSGHSSRVVRHYPEVRFQIKKEAPAYGLTLGWSLPEDQLQQIVGSRFKPAVKDGYGFLMLFITNADQYYIDGAANTNLKLAHIVIPVEGAHAINAPLSISMEGQKITDVLKQYNFLVEMGTADLVVKTTGNTVSVEAIITTAKGKITLSATADNKPGEVKSIELTTISATKNPNSYFLGPESYRQIDIASVKISSEGENWISQLKLPAKPDRIWLSTDFNWDFAFRRN